MIPVTYMRRKGFVPVDFETISQVEIVAIISKGLDWLLIGSTGEDSFELTPSDLCETIEEAICLGIRKYQIWN